MSSINVIIHGFGGTTAEVAYLKEYLDKRGLNTRFIVLAGHGGTKHDLHKTGHNDWVKSAQAEIAKLQRSYSEINLIGFSMGGLIVANLARKYKVNKLVFINTPIYFWNIKIILKNIIDDLRSGGRENIGYFRKSVFNVSLKSSIHFLHILFKSKKILNGIRNQSLVLQCINDETVRHKSARYIQRKLGKNCRLRIYRGGCHQVFLKEPHLKNVFCQEIFRFLSN